jgi:hypothetical protein
MAIRASNVTFQVMQSEDSVFAVASNTIDIGQSVASYVIYQDYLAASSTLNISQAVVFSCLSNQVVSTLNMQQDVQVTNLHQHPPTTVLNINQNAEWCMGLAPSYSVETTLDIQQKTSLLGIQEVETVLAITHDASWETRNVTTILDIRQTVDAGIGEVIRQSITISDAVQLNAEWNRSVLTEDIVSHAMTYYIDSPCAYKNYQQFVGEGSSEGIEEPRLAFNANMALESRTGDVLILRNPETDDGDRLGFQRINRETRGGELNVFGDPIWGKINTLLFTIVALADGSNASCPDVINATLDFFQTYLGQEIWLHDWTGTSWHGVVTTPNERAVEDRNSWWTLTFEFQGEPYDGSAGQANLDIGQTVSIAGSEWNRPLIEALTITHLAVASGDSQQTASNSVTIVQAASAVQEIILMQDDFTAGAASALHGTSPTVGSNTWVSHANFQDDGTMSATTDAGAYYSFTPVDGTQYELEIESADVTAYKDGWDCLWGFFEGVPTDVTATGSTNNGNLNPTCAKAVHCCRTIPTADKENAYRLGRDSDGLANTAVWTNAALRDSASTELDLKILLDTTTSPWQATWYAKETASGSYTEVGPATPVLSENIAAVGFASNQPGLTFSTDVITLRELRPV